MSLRQSLGDFAFWITLAAATVTLVKSAGGVVRFVRTRRRPSLDELLLTGSVISLGAAFAALAAALLVKAAGLIWSIPQQNEIIGILSGVAGWSLRALLVIVSPWILCFVIWPLVSVRSTQGLSLGQRFWVWVMRGYRSLWALGYIYLLVASQIEGLNEWVLSVAPRSLGELWLYLAACGLLLEVGAGVVAAATHAAMSVPRVRAGRSGVSGSANKSHSPRPQPSDEWITKPLAQLERLEDERRAVERNLAMQNEDRAQRLSHLDDEIGALYQRLEAEVDDGKRDESLDQDDDGSVGLDDSADGVQFYDPSPYWSWLKARGVDRHSP